MRETKDNFLGTVQALNKVPLAEAFVGKIGSNSEIKKFCSLAWLHCTCEHLLYVHVHLLVLSFEEFFFFFFL